MNISIQLKHETAPRLTPARRRVLFALVAVGLAVRLAALATEPNPNDLSGLSGPNGEMARNILVHGRWFVVNERTPTADLQRREHRLIDPADINYARADRDPKFVPYRIQMPGPALLLATVWLLTGQQRYLPLQLAQALLDALAVLLVYWISRRLYGSYRAALLAAAGYALFLPMAMLIRIPFYDPWAVFATIGAFALFLRALHSDRPWPLLLATGATIGVGMWFRPAIALLPIALAVALLARMAWRRAVIRGLVVLAVALALVAPYSLWTRSDRGQFTPVNVGFGQVLWQGLGEYPNPFGAVNDDGVTYDQVHAERPGLAYATPAYDSYLREKAFRAIGERPEYYLALVGRRIVNAIVPFARSGRLERAKAALGSGEGPLRERLRHNGSALATVLLALAAGPILLALAIVGIGCTWRWAWRNHLLLLAAAAATFATPILLAVQWRYVAPASFVYFVLAGVACDSSLATVGRRRRARRLVGDGLPVGEPT